MYITVLMVMALVARRVACWMGYSSTDLCRIGETDAPHRRKTRKEPLQTKSNKLTIARAHLRGRLSLEGNVFGAELDEAAVAVAVVFFGGLVHLACFLSFFLSGFLRGYGWFAGRLLYRVY